jgi:hypothetical protein
MKELIEELIEGINEWLKDHKGQYEITFHSFNPYIEDINIDVEEFAENLIRLAFACLKDQKLIKIKKEKNDVK